MSRRSGLLILAAIVVVLVVTAAWSAVSARIAENRYQSARQEIARLEAFQSVLQGRLDLRADSIAAGRHQIDSLDALAATHRQRIAWLRQQLNNQTPVPFNGSDSSLAAAIASGYDNR